MLRQALLAAGLILVGTLDAVHAGGGLLRYKDCPRPTYSPLHYWTPNAYRVAATFTSKGDYTFAPAEGQTHVVKFRCPSVDPFHRYLNTGLPYDPNGPFAPPAPVQPADPPKKAGSPY